MHRRLLTLLFAFLLLGMQQEAQVHALSHLGEQLHRAHDEGLRLPAGDATCAECALFAGSAAAAPNDSAALLEPVAGSGIRQGGAPPPALSAPSYYSSRAPPQSL
jgi:hypothetical protein